MLKVQPLAISSTRRPNGEPETLRWNCTPCQSTKAETRAMPGHPTKRMAMRRASTPSMASLRPARFIGVPGRAYLCRIGPPGKKAGRRQGLASSLGSSDHLDFRRSPRPALRAGRSARPASSLSLTKPRWLTLLRSSDHLDFVNLLVSLGDVPDGRDVPAALADRFPLVLGLDLDDGADLDAQHGLAVG